MKGIAKGLLFLAACVFQPLLAHLSPDETLDEIELKLEASPDSVTLLLDKVHILIRMGRLSEAKVVLERVADLEKESSADTTYLSILLYQKIGDLKKALALSDQGIERFPENFYQWEIRGQVSMDAGHFTEAIEALSHSLRLDRSGSARAYINLASLLLEHGEAGDRAKAITVLQEGIEKLGNPSELLHMSIRLKTDLGRYEAAIEDLERLEMRYGAQIPFAVKRAEILELGGYTNEAAAAYEEAIALLRALPKERQGKQVERMKRMFEDAKAQLLSRGDAD